MSILRALLLYIEIILLLLEWIQLPYIDRHWISHDNLGLDVISHIPQNGLGIHNDLEIRGEIIDNWSS
jgi:hypothetical protein